MSDGLVRAAVEQMEAWLEDQTWEPDPGTLNQWNAAFQAALARADKGQEWADLIRRAHEAGRLLEARAAVLAEGKDRVRAEIEVQARGNRALKGYGASTR
jgi:hypothetical protein